MGSLFDRDRAETQEDYSAWYAHEHRYLKATNDELETLALTLAAVEERTQRNPAVIYPDSVKHKIEDVKTSRGAGMAQHRHACLVLLFRLAQGWARAERAKEG